MKRLRPWALLALACALYWLCRRAYYVGFFNDDAFYIMGARSLLSGRYAQLSVPGAPPLIQYFPGFSLLLSPVAALSGGALWPYQLASTLLMAAALAFLYDAWSGWPASLRACALAVFALCPLAVSMGATVLSDVPLLALAAFAMARSRRHWAGERMRDWAPLLGAFALASLVRPTGALLGLSAAAALLWRRRPRPAAWSAAAAVLPAGAFVGRNLAETGVGLTYFSQAARSLRYAAQAPGLAPVWGHLSFYLRFVFVTTLLRWPWPARGLEAAAVGLGVVLAGYGARRAEGEADWELWPKLFVAAFLIVHLLWSEQAGRYALPVLPLCAAYWLRGAGVLARRSGVSPRRGWLALAALSVLLSLPADARVARASLWERNGANSAPEMTAGWIRRNVPEGAVLAAELDGRWYLATGRRVVHLPGVYNGAGLRAWLAAQGARYVVAAPEDFVLRSPGDLLPGSRLDALLRDGARFRLVYAEPSEGTRIYEAL